MKSVFADAQFWIAICNPRDQWHRAARTARKRLGSIQTITTDEVLGEFLTALSVGGPLLRRTAASLAQAILAAPDVTVLPQSRASFMQALQRYATRSDKSYSMTDCASMNVMDALGIREVLTSDRHFE